jgi:hypothetical protein
MGIPEMPVIDPAVRQGKIQNLINRDRDKDTFNPYASMEAALSVNLRNLQQTPGFWPGFQRRDPRDTAYNPITDRADLAMLGSANRMQSAADQRIQDMQLERQERMDFVNTIGGIGTPGELAAGGGFGVSSFRWTGDPESTALMKQGITPTYGADIGAQATANYFNAFGPPSFMTEYVQNKLGLTPEEMVELGYVQDPHGRWIMTEREDIVDETTTYYGGGGGGRRGGGGGGFSFSKPKAPMGRMGSRMYSWRIGV